MGNFINKQSQQGWINKKQKKKIERICVLNNKQVKVD